MSIAITGAAGFIGSNLVKALNDDHCNDLILIDFYQSFANTWEYSLKNAKYNQIIEPLDFLNNYNNFNITQIYHIGAISDTMVNDKVQYFKYNYEYTINLIKLFEKYSLNISNANAFFINASSSAVYGNGNGPLNTYAMSKKMIDDYIFSNFVKLKHRIISFKFFNVFGPGEYHKQNMASMIYQLYNEYKANNTLTIFEDGSQSRDHIYVKDLVANLISYFRKFNNYSDNQYSNLDLGSGQSTSFNDLLNIIKLALDDLYVPVKYKPMPEKIRKVYQTFTKAKFKHDWNPNLNWKLKDAIIDYYSILDGLNDVKY